MRTIGGEAQMKNGSELAQVANWIISLDENNAAYVHEDDAMLVLDAITNRRIYTLLTDIFGVETCIISSRVVMVERESIEGTAQARLYHRESREQLDRLDPGGAEDNERQKWL